MAIDAAANLMVYVQANILLLSSTIQTTNEERKFLISSTNEKEMNVGKLYFVSRVFRSSSEI